jgi:hypothetical protein
VSDEVLIAELERHRETVRSYFAHYIHQQELGTIVPPNPNISEIARTVASVLATHPVFGCGRNVFFAGKQLNLYHPHFTAHSLLQVSADREASSAVAWLHRVFKIERADPATRVTTKTSSSTPPMLTF